MHILWYTPRYLPFWAGGETYCYGIATRLVSMGHTVTIATHTPKTPKNRHRIHDESTGRVIRRLGAGIRARADVEELIQEHRPDLVLVQFEWTPRVVNACKKMGIPVGVVNHGPWFYDRSIDQSIREAVDLWVFNAVSCWAGSGWKSCDKVILYPPIDRDRTQARTHPGSSDKGPVTLVNLTEHKGGHLFKDMVLAMPDRPFIGVVGGYGNQIKADAPNLEIRPNSKNIAAVYGDTRVLVMPSYEESFGMAALEAAANGIPVVASDIPSLQESVGGGGVFVRQPGQRNLEHGTITPRELEPWLEAVRSLDDRATYEKVSQAGIAQAIRMDQFCWDQLEVFIQLAKQAMYIKPLIVRY